MTRKLDQTCQNDLSRWFILDHFWWSFCLVKLWCLCKTETHTTLFWSKCVTAVTANLIAKKTLSEPQSFHSILTFCVEIDFGPECIAGGYNYSYLKHAKLILFQPNQPQLRELHRESLHWAFLASLRANICLMAPWDFPWDVFCWKARRFGCWQGRTGIRSRYVAGNDSMASCSLFSCWIHTKSHQKTIKAWDCGMEIVFVWSAYEKKPP